MLTENYIITAAHCFKSQVPSEYYVVLSDYKISNTDDGQERHEIERIIVHNKFEETPEHVLLNDVALIKLKTPANSAKVGPVCLPYAGNLRSFAHLTGER